MPGQNIGKFLILNIASILVCRKKEGLNDWLDRNMTTAPTSDTLWNSLPFSGSEPIHYQFGPLSVWIQKIENDFILYLKRTSTEEIRCSVGTGNIPADLKASDRFAYDGEFEAIQAVPMLPERSIVVRPENPLKIISGQKTLFFCEHSADHPL